MTVSDDAAKYLVRHDSLYETRQAAGELADMFREALNDGILIPEVHTTAEAVTHELLGCVWHSAMMTLVDASLRIPSNIHPRIRRSVDHVINSQLKKLAHQILKRQQPLGPSDACKKDRP